MVTSLRHTREIRLVGTRSLAATRMGAWFDAVAGSVPISGLAKMVTRQNLRVLAYHGISDAARFAKQMEYLRRYFHPVGVNHVLDAIERRARLPDYSVWITFDDGDPSVIDLALPVLLRYKLPSTMFICPGLVDTQNPFWWQVVEAFNGSGLPAPAGLPTGDEAIQLQVLKAMPDVQRRSIVAGLGTVLKERGMLVSRRQITREELGRYVSAGGTVANHSWDHPCLDTCSPEVQRQQVTEAHDWIMQAFPHQTPVFAYPNGNHAVASEDELRRLGYQVAVLFDHHLAKPDTMSRFRLSRLRTNSDLTMERFRAILSGVHPLTLDLRTRLAGSRTGRCTQGEATSGRRLID